MKGKQILIGENQKEKVFYNNLQTYLEFINNSLSKKFKPEKLSNHIKILGGYAFKSSQYKLEGVPIIRISDFQNEKIDLSNVKYYEEKPEYDRYQLFEGDIIIAMTGGTIGKLGIVQKGLGKLYLNQRVGKFKIFKSQEFFGRYIYWLARGIQERVKGIGYGGAQPNISGKQIEEMKFPIPDKKIQEKIVNFLEDLMNDGLKNKNYFNKKIEKEILRLQSIGENLFEILGNSQKDEILLKKLKQSILSDAVSGKLVEQNPGDEPASELLKKIKKEKEKLIKDGKIKRGKELLGIEEGEVPYELPKGWEWCRLGDVCKFINGDRGKNYPSKEKLSCEGIPFISAINLQRGTISTDNLLCVSEEQFNKLSSGKLRKNDLVFCIRGSLGKSCIYPFRQGAIASSLVILRQFKFFEVFLNYLNYYINSSLLFDEIKKYDNGTAQPNLAANNFKNFLFPLPPLAEQKRIVAKVDELMKYCDELELRIKENKKSSELLIRAMLGGKF